MIHTVRSLQMNSAIIQLTTENDRSLSSTSKTSLFSRIVKNLSVRINGSTKIIFLIICLIVIASLYHSRIIKIDFPSTNPFLSTFYPSVIVPLNATIAGFPILDFILIYDPVEQQLDSLFLSGYRDTLKWSSIDCLFVRSQASTKCLINRTINEPSVTCPLPPFERDALQKKQAQISVRLNFHNRSDHQSESSIIKVPVYPRRHFNISIYTMIKNKNYELIEWIEYHLLLGIEHFYLYNHLGDDHVEKFLRSYLDRGLVTIVQWPYRAPPKYHWNIIQSASMNHMLKNFGPFNRWVGYFDVDEYFFINETYAQAILNRSLSLPDLLDRHFPAEKYSGGVQFQNCPMSCSINQDDLLISRYTLLLEKCQVLSDPAGCRSRFKLFLRPKYVPLMQNIHALSIGVYAGVSLTKALGRFQHYHYGNVSSPLARGETFSKSLQPYIDRLRSRVIFYGV